MKIYVLMPDNEVRRRFLPPDACAALEKLGRVVWQQGPGHVAPPRLREILADADVLVTGWECPKIEGAMLPENHAPALLAHTGGTLAPYIDAAAMARGVRAVCGNEMFAQSVAEGALAYMLAALRSIVYWNGEAKAGRWRDENYQNQSLLFKRVGITGYGAVARNLIPMLKPFRPEILLYADHLSPEDFRRIGARQAGLEEIFATCGVISLHNSLTEETRGMVGRPLLQSIRPGAVLVNTARGALIDQDALVDELATGRFSALLDVLETEPPPASCPLLHMPNVTVIPHMAGPTADLHPQIGRAIVEEIGRFAAGLPLRFEVGPETLARMTVENRPQPLAQGGSA